MGCRMGGKPKTAFHKTFFLILILCAVLDLALSKPLPQEPKVFKRCDGSKLNADIDPLARLRASTVMGKNGMQDVEDGHKIVYIPVVFHVCRSDDARSGNIPEDSLLKNIAVLNEAHQGLEFKGTRVKTGFQFFLQGIIHWDITDFYERCDQLDIKMKQLTAVDQESVLNVYTCWSSMLGFAYLPSTPVFKHGVHINTYAFPSSDTDNRYASLQLYNRGHTLVHEVGHFLGLEHTFYEKCGPNDVDTAPEAQPYYGTCDPLNPDLVAPDTCPMDSRRDPINNFMDYSQDECMRVFTEGQARKMRESMRLYKPRLASMSEPLRCVTRGMLGSAHRYALCADPYPLFTLTPDGQTPPIHGWCRTKGYPSKWGDACCPGSCDFFPSNIVSTFPPAPIDGADDPTRVIAIPSIDPKTCLKKATWNGARKQCKERMMHLCSSKELANGVLLETLRSFGKTNNAKKKKKKQLSNDCNVLGSKYIWTSDTCTTKRKKGAALVMRPNSKGTTCVNSIFGKRYFACCM